MNFTKNDKLSNTFLVEFYITYKEELSFIKDKILNELTSWPSSDHAILTENFPV